MIFCDNQVFLEAATFYQNKLGIPDDCLIAIAFNSELDVAGCYFPQKTEEGLDFYMIILDPTDDDPYEDHPIEVLAHEMVHVRQYYTGQLSDFTEEVVVWNSQRYNTPAECSDEYYFSPWEQQAFGLQRGLFNSYANWIEECLTQKN